MCVCECHWQQWLDCMHVLYSQLPLQPRPTPTLDARLPFWANKIWLPAISRNASGNSVQFQLHSDRQHSLLLSLSLVPPLPLSLSPELNKKFSTKNDLTTRQKLITARGTCSCIAHSTRMQKLFVRVGSEVSGQRTVWSACGRTLVHDWPAGLRQTKRANSLTEPITSAYTLPNASCQLYPVEEHWNRLAKWIVQS